ncbi:MAG TPA: DUF1232 domain-containing protein [Bacillota bacterium]|nr:DUF1232 domain-containing protein [Bacillota bacterium]
MKPTTKFNIQDLSMSGEWDETHRMLVISELDGKLGLEGKFMGFKVNIQGSMEATLDNYLAIKVNSIGNLPMFLIPGILKLFRALNPQLAAAASFRGNELLVDPSLVIPDSSELRILLQPNTFEVADEALDSFRERFLAWTQKNAGALVKEVAEIILTIPDLLTLFINLAKDPRIASVLKLKIALCIAYVLTPVDLIPEILAGPLGFADDAVAMGFLITGLVSEISPEIIREHWKGHPEVLELILKGHGLAAVISKLPEGILRKLADLFGKKEAQAEASND